MSFNLGAADRRRDRSRWISVVRAVRVECRIGHRSAGFRMGYSAPRRPQMFNSGHQSSQTDGVTKTASGKRTLAVVFGAAVRADGSASPTLARRVGYAAAAAEADPSVDLFLSGRVGDHPPSEAAVMAALLAGNVSAERLTLDEISGDTLQTVRAAAAHARTHGYVTILSCTDSYHQLRVRMLFWLMGFSSRSVPLPARGPKQLRVKMWLRECAAIPYDLVAGICAAWRDRCPPASTS